QRCSRHIGHGTMSSTSWKNQAPAMVAAATSAIALAATSAGFCARPAACGRPDVCVLKSVAPAVRMLHGLVSRAVQPVEAARNHIRAGWPSLDGRYSPPRFAAALRQGPDHANAPVAELVDALDSKSS